MSAMYETMRVDNLIITLRPDTDPENPRRGMDNAGHIVLFGNYSGYGSGDPHEWRDILHFCEWWQAMSVIGGVMRLLSHVGDGRVEVGIWMDADEALRQRGNAIHPRFIGAAYMTVEDMRREGIHSPEAAEELLRVEVDTFSCWRAGDCWGFVITDEHGTELDSCWGYYGLDDCKQQARERALDIADGLKHDYCI